MLEREIEKCLVKHIKNLGGLCIKLTSSSMIGLPDRLVILDKQIIFIELKSPNQKPRLIQKNVMRKLKKLGCDVRVIDNKIDIDRIGGIPWDKHLSHTDTKK